MDLEAAAEMPSCGHVCGVAATLTDALGEGGVDGTNAAYFLSCVCGLLVLGLAAEELRGPHHMSYARRGRSLLVGLCSSMACNVAAAFAPKAQDCCCGQCCCCFHMLMESAVVCITLCSKQWPSDQH